MQLDELNVKFLQKFFKGHDVYLSKSLPWQFYNYENGKYKKYTNMHVRLDFLFSEYGFFNETYKERDVQYLDDAVYEDFSKFHRQKRYIVQEFIDNDGVFSNPTHHSFRAKNRTSTLDINNFESINNFKLVTHPGNTRFAVSCYIQDNLTSAIMYFNKSYNFNPPKGLVKITNIQGLDGLWKPHHYFSEEQSNLIYDFYFGNKDNLKNGTKYHIPTQSNVLKLWKFRVADNSMSRFERFGWKRSAAEQLIVRGVLQADSNNYLACVFDSSKDIGIIVDEKPLTIYTNSDIDIKEYFLNIRNELINMTIKMNAITDGKNKHHVPGTPDLEYQFYVDRDMIEKHFKFEVKVVDTKPTDIPKLNKYKGFAIWIDKDKLQDINREIYELLFYTRRDVKVAKTDDGKVEVINCRKKVSNFDYNFGVKNTPLIEWGIKDSFLKCDSEFDVDDINHIVHSGQLIVQDEIADEMGIK